MKKFLSIVFAGLITLSISACSNSDTSKEVTDKSTQKSESSSISSQEIKEDNQETILINHYLGETEVKLNPNKVVVLDLAMLDTMDALGLSEKIVGIPK